MDTNSESTLPDLTHLTAEVLTSYLSNNQVAVRQIPELMESIYLALAGLGEAPVVIEEKPIPAVSIKKSITPDYLVSLEDGRHFKSLKRHLAGRGMTPAEYREKWDLPRDYPMVAASYAQKRSELAKALGLGQQRRKSPVDAEPAASAPAKRGRKKAA